MDDNGSFVDNTTVCNNTVLKDFPSSLNIPVAINYVQGSIALVLGIVGFLLNAIILIMIVIYRSLKRRLMFIAVQIVIIELIYTFFVPPAILVSSIYREWIFGVPLCNIFGIINDTFGFARFMMTLVLTLDRFISVFFPFFHAKHAKKILALIITISYLFVLIRIILPITGVLSCYAYIPGNKICTASTTDCSDACLILVFASAVIVVVLGAFIPLILYVILFCKACAYRLKTAAVNYPSSVSTEHPPNNSDGDKSSSPCTAPSKSIGAKKSITSRSTLSNKKFQHNVQVNITMFMLLLSVIGCTAPSFVMYFTQFAIMSLQLDFTGQGIFYIFVMLVGRTSFNAIPIVDALTIMRDREFRKSFARCCGKSAWSVATINAVRDDDIDEE